MGYFSLNIHSGFGDGHGGPVAENTDLGISYYTIVYTISEQLLEWPLCTMFEQTPVYSLSRHSNIICHLPSASTICYLHKSSILSVPSVHLNTIVYYVNLFIFMLIMPSYSCSSLNSYMYRAVFGTDRLPKLLIPYMHHGNIFFIHADAQCYGFVLPTL